MKADIKACYFYLCPVIYRDFQTDSSMFASTLYMSLLQMIMVWHQDTISNNKHVITGRLKYAVSTLFICILDTNFIDLYVNTPSSNLVIIHWKICRNFTLRNFIHTRKYEVNL